jgi:transcriptional regulator with XRE-family HTH domain
MFPKTDPNIPNYPVDTLGDRIKSTRLIWGLPQAQFAQLLHCDQASVSLWEADKVIPGGTSLVALAALFGCSVETLETGKGFVLPAIPAALPVFQ